MSLLLDAQRLSPILVGVAAGALVQGFAGFGFAIVAAPLMALFMPPAAALPYVMALQALLGISGLPGALRLCQWPMVRALGAGLVLGTPLGLAIITRLSPPQGRVAVALAAAAAFLIILAAPRLKGRPPLGVMLGAGLAAGVMNGLAGMAGPPAVALILCARLEAKAARSTLLVFIFLAALAALAPLTAEGRLSPSLLSPSLVALPVLAAGFGLGSLGFRRTSATTHRVAALLVIGMLTLACLLRAAHG
jgi:uncharacterized membrane protein YfcA